MPELTVDMSREFLLNNYIEKDIQCMLCPVYKARSLFFLARCRIKDNFVTSNTVSYNIISCLVCILIICLFIVRSSVPISGITLVQKFSYVTIYGDLFLYVSGFVLNFVNNIKYSEISVSFVVLLNSVYKKQKNYIYPLKNIIRNNRIQVGSVFLFYFLFYSTLFILYKVNLSFQSSATMMLLIFDINLIYAIQILTLLNQQLYLWNLKFFEDPINIHERNWATEFQICKDILKLFNIFKETFNLLVLYSLLELFFHALIYVNTLIIFADLATSFEDYLRRLPSLVLVLIWMIKNVFLFSAICVKCESMYATISEVQTNCSKCVNLRESSGERERLNKNIQRLIQASFTKWRIGGLFPVDAKLPLKLGSVFAAYAIVMLQFALEKEMAKNYRQ